MIHDYKRVLWTSMILWLELNVIKSQKLSIKDTAIISKKKLLKEFGSPSIFMYSYSTTKTLYTVSSMWLISRAYQLLLLNFGSCYHCRCTLTDKYCLPPKIIIIQVSSVIQVNCIWNQTTYNLIRGAFESTWGHNFYMGTQNGSKLEVWWRGLLIHASESKLWHFEVSP